MGKGVRSPGPDPGFESCKNAFFLTNFDDFARILANIVGFGVFFEFSFFLMLAVGGVILIVHTVETLFCEEVSYFYAHCSSSPPFCF